LKKKKEKGKTNPGKDVEKLECSYLAGGNIKWFGRCGKQFGSSSISYT